MARPYKIVSEQIDDILEELRVKILGMKTGSDELKVNLNDDRFATIVITPMAWAKMTALIACYTTEVEWHYCARRLSEFVFEIFDVVVPPHIVTGSTVTADDEKYNAWICGLPDEIYDNLRGHGHSHVNMAVTPSGVDMSYRDNLMTQVNGSSENDAFYIFMIFNKSYKWSAQVYDIKNNTVYETDDIDLCVDLDDGSDVFSFIEAAKKIATTAPATPPKAQTQYSSGYWSGGKFYPYSGSGQQKAHDKGNGQQKTHAKAPGLPAAEHDAQYEDDFDDLDEWYQNFSGRGVY